MSEGKGQGSKNCERKGCSKGTVYFKSLICMTYSFLLNTHTHKYIHKCPYNGNQWDPMLVWLVPKWLSLCGQNQLKC